MQIINENTILHENKKYRAVEGNSCAECAFSDEICGFCNDIPCNADERKDGKIVVFKLVEK